MTSSKPETDPRERAAADAAERYFVENWGADISDIERAFARRAGQAALAAADAEVERAPTQWAYDQACAALAKCKAEVERLKKAWSDQGTETVKQADRAVAAEAQAERLEAELKKRDDEVHHLQVRIDKLERQS